MIKIFKYTELGQDKKKCINDHIKLEFGHIPIVKNTEWSTPDWTVIYFNGNEITTFYNIIERKILLDDNIIKIAGVSNVITPKNHRGLGYASCLLSETENFLFNKLNCEMGLLLCADILISFYEKLGWESVDCPVYFNQSKGLIKWEANAMTLSHGRNLEPKFINLNGLPW